MQVPASLCEPERRNEGGIYPVRLTRTGSSIAGALLRAWARVGTGSSSGAASATVGGKHTGRQEEEGGWGLGGVPPLEEVPWKVPWGYIWCWPPLSREGHGPEAGPNHFGGSERVIRRLVYGTPGVLADDMRG